MKKRWLPLLLVLAILVGLCSGLSLTASAENETKQLYGWYVDTAEDPFTVVSGGFKKIENYVNHGYPVYFTTDAACTDRIPMDSLYFVPDTGSAASVEIEVNTRGFWDIHFRGIGTGKLCANVGEAVYAMDVTITMPPYGWSTSTNLTAQSLFSGGDLCFTGTPVLYFVSDSDHPISAVAVENTALEDKITISVNTSGTLATLNFDSSVNWDGENLVVRANGNGFGYGNSVHLVDGSPRLALRHVREKESELFAYQNNNHADTEVVLTPDSSHTAAFVVKAGNELADLDVTDVTVLDPTVAAAELVGVMENTGYPVYWLRGKNFGETSLTVSYQTADGKTGVMSMDVTVKLPDCGFSSDKELTADTWLRNGFAYSDTDRTFYFVSNMGTIQSFELDHAGISGAISEDGSYISLTIADNVNPDGETVFVEAHGESGWSYNEGINLFDGADKLVFLSARRDSGSALSANQFNSRLTLSPNYSNEVVLYLRSGNVCRPLADITSVVAEDSSVASANCMDRKSDNNNPIYLIEGLDFGETVLTVTYGGGKTMELPVKVELPEDGWFIAPEHTADSWIGGNEFYYTDTDDTVYFLFGGHAFTSFMLMEEYAQWEDHIVLTICNNAETPYVKLELQKSGNWEEQTLEFDMAGDGFRGSVGLHVRNGNERLGYYSAWYQNGVLTENNRGDTAASLNVNPGTADFCVFYSNVRGETAALEDITDVSVSDPELAAVTYLGEASNGNPVYEIRGLDFGSTKVTVTYNNGKTLSMPVSVVLPDNGWSMTPSLSEESFIPRLLQYTDTIPNLYYIRENQTIVNFSFWNPELEAAFSYEIAPDGHWIKFTPKPGKLYEGEFGGNFEIAVGDQRWSTGEGMTLRRAAPGPVMKWVENGKETTSGHDYAGLSLNKGGYRDLVLYHYDGTKTVALKNITSVVSADAAVMTVRSTGSTSDCGNPIYNVSAAKEGRTVLTVTYDGGKTLQIPVAVTEPPFADGSQIMSTPAFVDDYAVGFVNYLEDVALIMDGMTTYGSSSSASQNSEYQNYRNLEVCAGIKDYDAQGAAYYLVETDAPIEVKLKKAWIQNISGDDNVFSFSTSHTTRVITNLPEGTTMLPIYYRPGQVEYVVIHAELEITYEGQTFTKVATTRAFSEISGWEEFVLDEDDTVEDINALLEKLAGRTLDREYGYNIILRNQIYEGTIRLPDDFCWNNGYEVHLHFTGAEGNGESTVLIGGIDINEGAIDLEDINFRAGENDVSALYGGAVLNCFDCTFYGYDIACDAVEGMITLTEGNIFVNNTIAARIDGEKHFCGSNLQPWLNNSFFNNETAVQILSFNQHISSFNFRIYDCNFINNGTDFDVQGEGNVYYYRNYFGHYEKKNGKVPTPGKPGPGKNNGKEDLRLQELLEARSLNKLHSALVSNKPVVKVGAKTRLTTNPRWKYPVLDWWKNNVLIDDAVFGSSASNALMLLETEPDYVNYLTSDWETQTEIINNEADDLILDAAAFEEEGTKEIDVVDQQSNTIGTWTFE